LISEVKKLLKCHRGASDMVKAKSSGEDPRATGGLVYPGVNKTKATQEEE